ncbi:MAG: hypothetical protein PHH83_01795 [Patescibacteria group bacterium]|nr:hypothetical protein [Patescibacteria group bacterium]
MQEQKSAKSILNILYLVLIILCLTIIAGLYINSQHKKIRDAVRLESLKQIKMLIELYRLEFDGLPENQTKDEWDRSFNLIDQSNTLFQNLKQIFFESNIADPANDNNFHYRYHKFQKGEYGCDKTFAIFQVTSFENEIKNIGSGSCPHRDFTKEAPNGFTIQWFE